MLHNANIYSNSKGDNALFIHAKSSLQMLNTFGKTKNKNVIFWGRMLVRSPILTIAFRPHVDIRSCTVEHIKMLHLYPIFHHMCCKVSGFMVDLEAEW